MIAVEDVRQALRTVADPCAIATGVPVDIVAMGLVDDIAVAGADVTIVLRLTSPFCLQVGLLSEQIGVAVRRIPGVNGARVEINHGAEWLPEMMEPGARMALRRARPLPAVSQ
jgi:metal-sulfur cluster biosynthetic enzyme